MPEWAQAVLEDEFQKWCFLGAGEGVFDCAQGLGGVVREKRSQGQSMISIMAVWGARFEDQGDKDRYKVYGLRYKVTRFCRESVGVSFYEPQHHRSRL